MTIYESFRSVPTEAQKEIKAGKLKGFTDINPMWRIKKLTEQFGPAGIGWKTEIAERWVDQVADQYSAHILLHLFIKVNGEWSEPIEGLGGSMLFGRGVGDGQISDEAYKMAYTDALGTACKALGMAADIYYAKDRTKYNMNDNVATSAPAPKVAPKVAPKKEFNPEPAETKPLEEQNISDSGLFPPEQTSPAVDIMTRVSACKDVPTLQQIWKDAKALLSGNELEEVKKAVAKKNRELNS